MRIWLLAAVLGYLFVLVVGVGGWLARREKSRAGIDGEFALGGRSLGRPWWP